MVSQKNLSHSSLIRSAAPPRRFDRTALRFLGVRASWFEASRTARGGLDGGEGSPEEGTSGIPLCPGEARSAVVEPAERGDGSVDEVAAGKDIGLADNTLAIITTT